MNMIDGVWMNNPCDFDAARAAAANPAPFVMISRSFANGGCFRHDTDAAHESCMASFLTWVRPGMYFSCVDPSSDYAHLADNCLKGVKPNTPNPDGGGPVQSKIRVPLFAARTLNAVGQSRVTLSLRQERLRAALRHDRRKGG